MAISSRAAESRQEDVPMEDAHEAKPTFRNGRLSLLPDVSDPDVNWGRWFECVHDFCIKWNIWDYVNPAGYKTLVRPELPEPPKVSLPENPIKPRQDGETREQAQQRKEYYTLECQRLEQQHRLDFETYKCQMQRYNEELKEYMRAHIFIRNLRVHIMECARDKYCGLLSHVEEPRHQILILIERGRPSVGARFMAVVNDNNQGNGGRDWYQWIGQVERAWSHCVSFHIELTFARAAVDSFLQQIGLVDPEFRDHWRLQLEEAWSQRLYLNLYDITRVFRDVILPQRCLK